jgi:uncharacterized Ntn-hydrolase superfamily protein
MTFSIVARCRDTGMFGAAVSSSSPAVGARCPYVRAGVGAAMSQNVTDPTIGPFLLDKLASGYSASTAIELAMEHTTHPAYRQFYAIGPSGEPAIFSGTNSLGIWNDAKGTDSLAAGNLLATKLVPAAMVEAFEISDGTLGDRLLSALKAALKEGGEAGPVHSSALLLSDKCVWPIADLRCDWTLGCPIDELSAAWQEYKPQMHDYVTRALDPSSAPSYGVLGNE